MCFFLGQQETALNSGRLTKGVVSCVECVNRLMGNGIIYGVIYSKDVEPPMTAESAIAEFANDAFYLAFNSGDLDQMSAIWSRDYPVVCIHPGWPPLFGYEAVLQSWEQIFTGRSEETQIICHEPRIFSQAGLFSVICYEELEGGWLIATNNFVMDGSRALMVHHQAGFCSNPPDIIKEPQSIQ